MELVCPAGSIQALKAAMESGADAVYTGLNDETNARHFSGLNLRDGQVRLALDMAASRGIRLYLALNTYARSHNWKKWQYAVDLAADLGINALICADFGVMDYAAHRYPELNLHLSVQGSATNAEALRFHAQQFNVRRAVLPRVLSLKQIARIAQDSPVDLEVFGFGSLCIMAEGRCYLSSYITDQSPNNCGACSPAKDVRWKETSDGVESRLNGVLIDRYRPDEPAAYPTLCKGRFSVDGKVSHALEAPTSLNTLELIPQLARLGISAVKIEGRQRSPAYVRHVVRTWRQALDAYQRAPASFVIRNQWQETLERVSEGTQTTLGAYSRRWQ